MTGLVELGDILAARKVTRKLLEKDIQKTCIVWARERGYWARKFSSPANRSVPDYLFAKRTTCPAWGKTAKFWVEFKAPGKTSTEAQLDEQRLMTAAGWDGFECDNVAKFKAAVIAYEAL